MASPSDHAPKISDGKAIAHTIRSEIAEEVRNLSEKHGKIKGDWIKSGAAVIDVGTNAVSDPSRKSGYRLVGDVDFAEASKVAAFITPVPGSVGPMTVAMLLRNTLDGTIAGHWPVKRHTVCNKRNWSLSIL